MSVGLNWLFVGDVTEEFEWRKNGASDIAADSWGEGSLHSSLYM